MRRFSLLLALFASVAVLAPAAGQACSRDDAVFFETFVDTSCLQLPLLNTTLDAQGGLRLTTNGTPGVTPWDTHTDFDNGITFQSVTFPPVGVRTLDPQRIGAGSDARPADNPPSAHPRCRKPRAEADGLDHARQRQRRRPGARESRLHVRDVVLGHGRRRQPARTLRRDLDRRAHLDAREPAARRSCKAPHPSFDQDGVYGADVVYDPADTQRRTGCGTRAAPACSARSATPRRRTGSRGRSTRATAAPCSPTARPARRTASAPPTRPS